MPGKPTLIVFGATSYTAQELLPYLDNHPDGDDFDFILAGRNKQKLDALNDKRPKRRQVAVCDSNDEDAVKALVEKGDVVINLAGPFRWHGGEHFIKHCAIAGKHYVDLSGESHWLAQDIIPKYDYLASKTGACIVPSCGFDSIPSDLTLYYALRTLQHSYPSASITSSISYFKLRGGVSGGTVATMKSLLEVPAKERAQGEWALLSSANGSTPSPQFVYKTPVPSDGGRQEKKIGSFFFMYPYNRCIVRRSWFLSRLDTGVVSSSRQASHDNDDEQDDEPRHGDGFEYREAMETGSTLKAMLISGASLLFGVLFFGFSLTRRLLLAFVLPSPGEGVDEEQRAKGSMFITNISNTTEEGLDVVSTCQGKGDPGYKITAFMLAESALALVLPPPKGTSLPPIGIRGGVLTPSAAMGMVLVERLQKSGTVLFESRLVGKPKRS